MNLLLGICSDMHVSEASSMMRGRSSDGYYSIRLQMIVDTYKWMYELFGRDVDVIVDAGDLLDDVSISAEEIEALSEAFSYSKGVPEWHICGTHEMYDRQGLYSSVSHLGLLPDFQVFKQPQKVNDEVSVLPYNKNYDDKAMLENIANKVLVSHNDIQGIRFGNKKASEVGFRIEDFDGNFEVVLNGHYHSYSTIGRVINIGSSVSHSFSDYYANGYPSVHVFDTETLKIESYFNKNAILFYSIEASSIDELAAKIGELDRDFACVLSIVVPYQLRDEARGYVDRLSGLRVLNSRVVGRVDNSAVLKEEVRDLRRYSSGVEAIKDYVDGCEKLPASREQVMSFIDEVF